ncbi:MAG: thiol reductant ABC exporter subunit CydD [Corticimicrobacter sp.]|uniref:thiol reductant ABC exporter subunit CydD n=1 Tax=Corticimicrobacter sp. TaxID=2678536 RepID=UPI0032DB69B8
MSGGPARDRTKQAQRWLRSCVQAGNAGAWNGIAILAGAIQTLAAIAQAGILAWLLHGLIILRLPWAELAAAWYAWPASIAVRALAGVVREYAGQRVSARIRQHVRTQLLARLHQLGPAWREQQQSGALSNLLLEQTDALDGYFARYRPQQWLAVVAPVLILLAVLPRSWAAAAILLLTAPLIPVFMILVGWGAQARQTRQFMALKRMSGYFLDVLRGLPTLRLLDAHGRQAERIARTAEDFRIRTMSVLRLAFLSGTVLEFFSSVAIALTAVYLGFSLLGHLDFGYYGHAPDLQLAFFILLLAPEYYQPLRDLGTHYHARAEALAAAEALQEVLPGEPTVPEAGNTSLTAPADLAAPHATRPARQVGGMVPPSGAPSLQLDNLSFAYRPGEPVLAHLDLQVEPGAAIAIVGPSGGGKSTLLRLLSGQLAPDAGRIEINGVALSAIDLPAWRERIGWMGQHPAVLATSLAENLRVARHDASESALTEALAFAGLADWHASLPAGLDTQLGEGGRRLSGGQVRRLALARLALRPAELLLLDEPTASLDEDTEQLIVERLQLLRQGRTLVLLTHRRAPLACVDSVYRLNQHRLIKEETHAPAL